MRKKRLGIVLVTTLLMMVLVVMIVTVVVFTGAGGLALSGNFYEREAALIAADSGLQYAMSRLQTNPNWRGDEPTTVPSARPDFSVMEKDGNVFGFMATTFGHRSQFRIKFNYEDGDGGADSLGDTADARYVLAIPFVSVNNLLGTASAPVARARADGYGVASGTPPYEVPRASACIMVEGLAGWGVREADMNNPNSFQANRTVTRRLVEAYYVMDNSGIADSAAYAAGTIDADLADGGIFAVSSKDDDVNPRMRSLQGIDVEADEGLGPVTRGATYDDGVNGEVVVGRTHTFTVNGSTPTDANVTEADSSSLFKKITWNSIAKASATSTSDAQVNAGTYVWRQDSGGQPYLEYFDVEYSDGMTLPTAGSGTRINSSNFTTRGSGVSVDSENLTVMMTNNVYVSPSSSGASGFAVLTDPAVTADGLRPNLGFRPTSGSERAPILTSSGSVRVEGAVMGTGAVTSEGAITFQGPSILESDPETGVSLYAKGDITVEAIPQTASDSRATFANQVETTVSSGGTIDTSVYMGGGTGTTSTGGGIILSGKTGKTGLATGRPIIPPGLVADPATFAVKKQQQLTKFVDKFGSIDYADQSLTGVIYTWRNFNANLGSRGVLSVTGTLIAYGGNPEGTTNNAPGNYGTDEGKIHITAQAVDLEYDSTYLKDLLAGIGPIKVKRSLWATY